MYELDMKNGRERVRAVMERMKEGRDYVRSGDRFTLLKGGAEMLLAEFGFSSQSIICAEKRYRGDVTYTMETRVFSGGNMIANGFGTCSTSELPQENQDMSRRMNSAIKMAKKRSFVDAVLTATASSWLFTQDIGDMNVEKPMTPNQERYIRSLMVQGGLDQDMIYEIMPDLNGTILEEMSRSEASRLIEALIEYMRYIGDQERMDR
ncbi:MAG: hypothetical protein ACYDAP_09775 [Thermoplasmataceae archaeon]